MAKSVIIYQEKQDVFGKHLQSKEYVRFTGMLTISNSKTKPVVLSLKNDITSSYFNGFMEDKKEFKGTSISEVFGKLSKWYYKQGIIFQN